MSAAAARDLLSGRLAELCDERVRANTRFFEDNEERLARLCHLMAERFAAGGRLLAFGASPAARSDARHVAVEFVHPVIVGKRALPAIGIAGEGGPLAPQLGLLARPRDIAMAFGAGEDGGQAAAALALARARGCLTIGFPAAGARGLADAAGRACAGGTVVGGAAEWEFDPPSGDPAVRQELVETLYHLLWELVHVFFEHRGLLSGRDERPTHDAGAAAFLYPFLDEREDAPEPVIESVRHSVRVKAGEIDELRRATLTGASGEALAQAAAATYAALRAGGKVLAFGNGGSATDAMDLVADLRSPPAAAEAHGPDDAHGTKIGGAETARRAWPAIDLTEDAAILTAVANDIGTEAIFARQVIAYGAPGDVLVALSTSGNSANLLAALREARRRGLATVALVGYDGGAVSHESLADHVIVSPSEHIPRIQEAQASAYHGLVELLGLLDGGAAP